ncbi:MAG: site-2 protease family protein [Oscillospiraceae bacterium]|nr:site-2 protease family protein [Oscillospiraceae bacterium]
MSLSLTMSISSIWGKVWPFLIAIVFFGFVIMFHEIGHFLFAKLFKVKVNEFSLGMGPTLLKKQKGETTYSVRLLPIGGFVSMEGEDEESTDERAFNNKPAWQRIIIVAAGGVINIIMGVILVAIMLCQTDLIGTTQIHSFYDNAVSAQSGLEAGDKIVEINGKHVFSQYDVSFLMMRDDDGVMDFVVDRNDEKIAVDDVKFKTSPIEGQENLIKIEYDFIIAGVKPTFLSVTKYAVLESISIGRMVWVSLFDLITGKYGLSELSGPIGVVNYVADAAEQSSSNMNWTPLLNIMALIAINIGLFNLLPIPALDGGRLLFLIVELIIRRPVPQKFEKWLHAVGLILLFGFMIIISFKDIITLIRG